MPPKPSSQEPLSPDKKARILEAAKARFLHYGISKTTMRDIAEDLGIAVSNLYLYFENKHEIVLAIGEQCILEQEHIDQQLLTDDNVSPPEKLERFLRERFTDMEEALREAPKWTELIAYLVKEAPDQDQRWQQGFEDLIHAVLAEGQRKGYFALANPRHDARMFRFALAQFFQPPHIELHSSPQESELVELIHWLLALIQAPGGKSDDTTTRKAS